jgi:hypothetical protein
MFSNNTIGRFFNLMGAINTVIRDNTTYKGTKGMSVASSQRNEYISALFHNLSFIGVPIQNNDQTTAYFHILTHIEWFNKLTLNKLSVYKELNIDIDEIKILFQDMKIELEPKIDKNILKELRERSHDTVGAI